MPDTTHQKKTIYLAADHAGFDCKNAVREWLLGEGFMVVDCGPDEYDAVDDFPGLIAPAAQAVAAQPTQRCAVVFGGSGQGEAMIANRYLGVRATVYYGGTDDIITLSRDHNDANVLAIGARFVSQDEVKRLLWVWLHTPASTDAKYRRRNQALDTVPK